MTRVHPQTEKAPDELANRIEAFTAAVRRNAIGMSAALAMAAKRFDVRLHATPKYGRGVPPGEPFTLTEEQLRQWKKK